MTSSSLRPHVLLCAHGSLMSLLQYKSRPFVCPLIPSVLLNVDRVPKLATLFSSWPCVTQHLPLMINSPGGVALSSQLCGLRVSCLEEHQGVLPGGGGLELGL